jgi:hypothetical protein
MPETIITTRPKTDLMVERPKLFKVVLGPEPGQPNRTKRLGGGAKTQRMNPEKGGDIAVGASILVG